MLLVPAKPTFSLFVYKWKFLPTQILFVRVLWFSTFWTSQRIFSTSDTIKYLELKRKLHLKNTTWIENTGFKLFSRKARHYESDSVCNALISLIRQYNGLLLFLHATLLCSLNKFSVKISFSLCILHLYWP